MVAKDGDWIPLESHHIISDVRAKSKDLKLSLQAIDPNLFGAHYICVGGTLALKLHGYNDTTIMKMVRWMSLTFLQYIHNQIAHLSKYISQTMSTRLSFVNMAAI